MELKERRILDLISYFHSVPHDHLVISDDFKLLFFQAHEFQNKNDFDLAWFVIHPALELMGS